ncbi:MAG: OsmC family protein [Candidatus Bathyarchaeales archaeon]
METTKGGTDSGPTALELSLMSLAGCAITIFADVARNSKIPLTKIEAEVEADKSPDSPKISNVNLKVHIAGKARRELLEAAWRKTEATCPVLFIYKEPLPVKVETEITSE